MVSFGDADIHDALKQIRDVNSSTNWMLLTHKPKMDKELKLVDSGEDGWEDMIEYISDGKVQFGFCRIDLGGTFKFVYLAYIGDGVAGMKKGLFNAQAQFVGDRLFTGYHVQINGRSEEDLDITKITGEVKKSAGASFYKTHADQSGESRPEESTVTYESRDADQSTENAPTGQHITYEKHNEDQSTESAPTGQHITYEKHNEDQSTENAPEASHVTYDSRDADQSTESAPAPSAVPRAAPPPAARPAPPVAPAAEEEEWGEEEGEEWDEEEAGEEEEWDEEEGGEEEEAGAGAGRTVTALYDYAGENEGDLVFSEGDVITILDDSDPDGWYQGELNGVTGYFPNNYIQE